MTLNGSRSEPKGRVGYRWFQLTGPQAVCLSQDRYIATFTPPAAGAYRFGLVVAAGSEISELDTVEVLVGTLPPGSPTLAPAQPLDELARTALVGLEGGAEAAESLASSFETLAKRLDLYHTYADLFSEMSRLLDSSVPQEPAQRAVWIQKLFLPLTARLVEQLRAEGLDLTRPEGPGATMTAAQKSKLADIFFAISKGFRAALPTP
jgi:hypothetical protein